MYNSVIFSVCTELHGAKFSSSKQEWMCCGEGGGILGERGANKPVCLSAYQAARCLAFKWQLRAGPGPVLGDLQLRKIDDISICFDILPQN